ncbi:glycoside hydrolase family 3 C-terminal domain-containing protein [Svornostia abyssi]|uniref:Glycoside hydrolase family 3 C-terminal domain-containing protein n=1 Tax=Svornostia abyssi TaxID=2898438 RepID=A0ABY5PIM7_9ACTN|nr:glycoside hydrolase family 3 C-terminal domain-containing protein [Parviterribacteraceae bacterium J379]
MLPGRSLRTAYAVAAACALLPTTTAAATACSDPTGRPWCDRAQDADTRARLLTAALTTGEKLKLLGGYRSGDHAGAIAPVPRLGVPVAYVDGSTIGVGQPVSADGRIGGKNRATQMPSPTALAATFDPALARRAGATIGDEARKKGNTGLLGPAADIMRVPYGGRTFESFGEDPHLSGRMAAAWIQGAESAGVFTSLKHFAVNNQEGRDPTAKLGTEAFPLGFGTQSSRYLYNAVVSERAMREIYLAPFETAIREGRPGSVMCAYNRVNGPYACASRHLLADVLRRDWGYHGLVMSDWIVGAHPWDAVAHFRNGLDLEMPSPVTYAPALLKPLLQLGVLRTAQLDEHVRRILRATIAAGILDDPPSPPDESAIDVDGHNAVARAVAEGGVVLLRNTGVLPLQAGATPRIAVLGPAARRSASGGGSGSVRPFRTDPVADALTAHPGAGQVTVDTTRDRARAASVARAADIAVVVVRDYETEGADRLCLTLRCPPTYGDQDALIEAVAAAQPNTVVVVQSGGPVLIPWRDRVAAVVQAWYPGQAGGTAIARVLFGDVDPSGRLPVTFPVREADLPTAESARRYPGTAAQNVHYEEGVLVGYRWYDARGIAPAYPFGFGLSYTSFAYSDLRVAEDGVTFAARNTGERRGAAVPQLYVGLPPIGGATVQPPWQLRGAEKVWLEPGERREVTLPLTARDLSSWDGGWKRATGCVRVAVGASSRDLPLRGTLGECG